jgi:hypothetical protein
MERRERKRLETKLKRMLQDLEHVERRAQRAEDQPKSRCEAGKVVRRRKSKGKCISPGHERDASGAL